MLTLDEAELLLSVLNAIDGEVNKRDRGLSATHEVGIVRLTLNTERAREFSAVVRRVTTRSIVENRDPTAPSAIDMVRQLREAIGMFAGAMSITPKAAWEESLVEATRLRIVADRCITEHVR